MMDRDFLVQKTAGETRITYEWKIEFQMHCMTPPPKLVENMVTVPLPSYMYSIWRSGSCTWAVAYQIEVQISGFNSESYNRRHISKMQHL